DHRPGRSAERRQDPRDRAHRQLRDAAGRAAAHRDVRARPDRRSRRRVRRARVLRARARSRLRLRRPADGAHLSLGRLRHHGTAGHVAGGGVLATPRKRAVVSLDVDGEAAPAAAQNWTCVPIASRTAIAPWGARFSPYSAAPLPRTTSRPARSVIVSIGPATRCASRYLYPVESVVPVRVQFAAGRAMTTFRGAPFAL